jgi:hypothetical protein
MDKSARTGLIRSILAGRGTSAIPEAQRIISPTGARDLEKITAQLPIKGMTDKVRLGLKHFVFGMKPLTTTAQRFRQGGLVGKGGVMRGPFAYDPRFAEVMKREGFAEAALQHPGRLASSTARQLMAGTVPAYSAYKYIDDPNATLPEALTRSAMSVPMSAFGALGNPYFTYRAGDLPLTIGRKASTYGTAYAKALAAWKFIQSQLPKVKVKREIQYPSELYRT